MILFDGIIFNLQKVGGVTVLFNEIFARLPASAYKVLGYKDTPPPNVAARNYIKQKERLLEMLRRVPVGFPYDIFHSTLYRLPQEESGKMVTTIHDFTRERLHFDYKRIVYFLQKKSAIQKADVIICVSESTRQDLFEFIGVSYEDRVVVVHNGVSTDYCPIPDTNLLPQVLFVGMRSRSKNFIALVEALSALNGLNLLCVGGGPFTMQEKGVLEKKLKGRYVHAGYVTNAQLNLEYNRSLCLVYPSLYEGFGIPVLEAMRARCPVIAVNTSSMPEVAGNAALLVDHGHPEEIRSAIEELGNDEKRQELINLGLQQALKFSWDKTFLNTVKVYENLSGKKYL